MQVQVNLKAEAGDRCGGEGGGGEGEEDRKGSGDTQLGAEAATLVGPDTIRELPSRVYIAGMSYMAA